MGAMAKITQVQVIIITVVLAVIAAAIIFFTLIKPTQEAYAAADAKFVAAEAIANKLGDAKKDRTKALKEVADAQRDWNRYDRQLMPDINISNLIYGSRQLWNEQIDVLGPKTERYLKADTTVRVSQDTLSLPKPSSDPNAVAKKQFTFEMGTVSVVGTFGNILRHAERWNRFDRLVLVDGLTLTGNSPTIQGTYSLTTYIFTHGDKVGTAIPQAAAATGGGGFGGGMGMGGGPMMGGEATGAPGGDAMPGM